MARGEDRKAALIAELARARAQIGGAADGVRAQLDVGAKVQRAVSRNLGGGSAVQCSPEWCSRNCRAGRKKFT